MVYIRKNEIKIILAFSCLSNHQSDDYRIFSKTGEKLPLYKGLYYGVSNKKSGKILQWNNQVKPPPIDPRNASNWLKNIFLLPESAKESLTDSMNELLGVFLVIFLYFIIKH